MSIGFTLTYTCSIITRCFCKVSSILQLAGTFKRPVRIKFCANLSLRSMLLMSILYIEHRILNGKSVSRPVESMTIGRLSNILRKELFHIQGEQLNNSSAHMIKIISEVCQELLVRVLSNIILYIKTIFTHLKQTFVTFSEYKKKKK